jgi:hypothetical protein
MERMMSHGRHNERIRGEPRHGKDPRLWPTILGLLAVVCVIAAVIILFVVDPK